MFGFEEEGKAQQELAEEVAKYSHAGVVSFLEQEWLAHQDERDKWATERAALNLHIERLQRERHQAELLQRDLLKRIRMLEHALLHERAKTDPSVLRGLPPLVDESSTDAAARTPVPRPGPRKSNEILQKYLREFSERSESLLLSFHSYPSTQSATQSVDPGSRSQPSSVASAASALASGLPLAALKGTDLGKSIMNGGHVVKEEKDKEKNEAEDDDFEKPAYPTIEKRRSFAYSDEQMQAFLQNKAHTTSDGKAKEDKEKDGKETEKDGRDKEKQSASSLSYSDRLRMEMEQERDGVSTSVLVTPAATDKQAHKATPAASAIKEEKKQSNARDSLGGLANLDKILENEVSTDSVSLGSSGSTTNVKGGKMWQPQFTLRHHLDVVRSLAFHEDEPMLVSASDDCTVKIWNWRTAGTVGFGKLITSDVEPIHTLIGHTGAVYTVALASSKEKIFSAGADCNLRVWELPDPSLNDPYAERGKAINFDLAVLKGHTDAIWDMSLHPSLSLILTASADETIKLWDYGANELKLTATYPETNAKLVPTSLCFLPDDTNKWVAGYTSSSVVIFDSQTGQSVQQMHPGGTPSHSPDYNSQINKVVAHGGMHLVITGHEDHTIRFWDPRTGGGEVHKMVAHQAPVSSLAIDPSGVYLTSTDHGLSVRFWEISSKNCVQEITSHRQKYEEGIYCLDFHPRLDLLATGGADACIKVYQ